MRLIDADALIEEIKCDVGETGTVMFDDPMLGKRLLLNLPAYINIAETIDAVPVVRCKDCKHRPTDTGGHNYGQDMEFPDDVCPCKCGDNWYSWMPKDDWFCADGERSDDETNRR